MATMSTKLTLSVDHKLVRKARRVARQNGTSVSAMFSRFIRALPEEGGEPRLGLLTRQAAGIAKFPKGMAYREVLTQALIQTYGVR